MESTNEIKYAYWRTDKAKEEGYSHELIACETDALLDRTDLDTLDVQPYEGVDTALKAIRRNAERIPDNNFLGTRAGAEYQWMSWKAVLEKAEAISHGCIALNLVPEVAGEGDEKWRFMAVQSKNRMEWSLLNLAGMHQGVTTVALYDTLGEEASRFVVGQTGLATIAVPKELVEKVCALKASDT